jgi:hypothetical protein
MDKLLNAYAPVGNSPGLRAICDIEHDYLGPAA